MTSKEDSDCVDCGAKFPNTEALQHHQTVAHAPSTGDRPENVRMKPELGAPRPRSEQSRGHENQKAEMVDEGGITGGPQPGAAPPPATLEASKVASDDPVVDRNGRSPELTGKKGPPTSAPTMPQSGL